MNVLMANVSNDDFAFKVLTHKIVINKDFQKMFVCDNIEKFSDKMFHNLYTKEEVKRLYTNICNDNKNQKLLWFNDDLTFSKKTLELYRAIENSYFHGLVPSNYHNEKIFGFINKIINNEFQPKELSYAINRLDLLLSDAYITLAQNMLFGFSNWYKFKNIVIDEKEKFEWIRRESSANVDVLYYLIEQYQDGDIFTAIEDLAPPYSDYDRLKEALQEYRNIKALGGWKTDIVYKEKLRVKKSNYQISKVKHRLIATGDLSSDITNIDSSYFDKILEIAVKRFQQRHNLKIDGIIGSQTIKSLNVSVSQKIEKIILNLDRYRWLPKDIDDSYIDINIPSYHLNVIENDQIIETQRVIVGKKKRPTPILNSKISTLVLNPYWTAPKTIIQKDFLRGLKKNPVEYAKGHDLRIYDRSLSKSKARELNVSNINWSRHTKKTILKYRFVQPPSNRNPLGNVKFLFANPFSVYMHDTSSRSLFKKDNRHFSSGCVRIQNPNWMIKYLIEKEGAKKYSKIEKKLKRGKNYKVRLTSEVPVIVRYMTSHVDRDSLVYFYEDIYSYDEIQRKAISQVEDDGNLSE